MREKSMAGLISLCLLAGSLPTTALAAEDAASDGKAFAVCACTGLCAEGAVDEACPICASDIALCARGTVVAPTKEGAAAASASLATGGNDNRANQGVQELYVGNTALVSGGAPTEGHVDNASYDAQSNTLYLNGVTVTEGHAYTEGATAGVYASGDLKIVLTGANVIGNDSYLLSHGISVAGNLTIEGGGSLTVYGDSNGIVANGDSYSLTIASGQINAYGGKAGLRGGNDLIIEDGEIAAQGGIKKGGTFGILANKGMLKILGGNVNAINQNASGGYGMKGAAGVEIHGGTVVASGTTYDIYTTGRIYVYDGSVSADNCSPSCAYMSGICGAEGREGSVTWKLEQNNQDGVSPTYTLTISGSGAMADYADPGGAPWYKLFPDKGAETAITKIEIGKDVTAVGANAFVWCKAVKSVTFAEGSLLEEIHLNGFHSLSKLTTIEFPSSLMKIEGAAFYGCSSLQTILFKDPGSLTALGGSAFGACTALKYFNSTVEGECIIPQNVATIGDRAFQKCTSLTAAAIPAGVETLAATFWGCSNLASVTFSQGSTLKQLSSTDTLGVFAGTALTSIELPDCVETIGDYCFSRAGLATVSVPARVQSIGAKAFEGCPLTSVEFAEGSELEEIGDMAFCGSTQSAAPLEGLIIPEGVKKVGNGILKNRKVVGLIRVPSTLGAGFSLDYMPSMGSCVLDASRTDYAIKPYGTSSYKLVYVPSADLKGNYSKNQAFAVTNGGIAVGDYADGELMDVERSGYIFDGWYDDADFSGTAVTAPEAGKTYYAKWLAEVKFDANGGEGSMPAQRVAENDMTTPLSSNTFSKIGYTFAGWNTAADGSGTSYAADAVASTVPSGTTLYAQWKANAYTVVFVGGNGATGSIESISATYDKPVTLPANGFTKKDMKFEGWDTDSSAEEVVYSDATQVKNLSADNGATVTLYAVWGAKPAHALDLSVQNGTYSGSKQAFDTPEGFSVSYQQEGEVVDPKDAGSYDVIIHADETEGYAEYNATVYDGLVIEKAPLKVKADDKSMYVGDKLPEFTWTAEGLKGTDTVESIGLNPSVTCAADGKTTGSFDIVADAAKDFANYAVETQNGKLTVANRPVTPPAPSDKTEVEQNDDGSITTTVTKPDGSQTVTVETVEGTKSIVKKDKAGNVASIEVTISKNDAEDGSARLPIDAIKPAVDTSKAVELDIKAPSNVAVEKPIKVTVPIANDGKPDYGAVVYSVDAKGITTLLPKTVIDKDGNAVFEIIGSTAIKVVDNAKVMADVKVTDWFAGDVVDFATARGIVNGVPTAAGRREFQGNGVTTRAMFVGMLHNLELAPKASTGDSLGDVLDSDWFAGAAAWALEAGVLEGVDTGSGREFRGGDPVTREQVAVFLMRYAGMLGLDVSGRADLEFVDGAETSEWAREAMSWAVSEGLFTGNAATGELNPTSGATRAEVATVLMRFINQTLFS